MTRKRREGKFYKETNQLNRNPYTPISKDRSKDSQ